MKQKILDDYQQQRDALLDLLAEGAALLDRQGQSLPSWKTTAGQFREKQRKLQSSQFTIALLAEMQSGKSTIFNSVACEGREFSPVGSFIRTSGCPVYASDLGDPKAEEHALIDWRSDEELLAGCDELLRPQLAILQPDRFAAPKGQDNDRVVPRLGAELKLTKAEDLALLRHAAELELALWKKDGSAYDPLGKGHLDVVYFALLVAEFYEHPQIQALKARSRFTVEEMGRYVRYPKDWEPRWLKGEAAGFRWEEVAFAFVRQARLFLHAPRLGKIGCTLVDCPGLFASRYDQQTAHDTMRSADAILYLMSGEKEISQSQLAVLREIRKNRMEQKLFFAWNVKTTQPMAEDLLVNLKAKLAKDGFKAATDDYFFIHAGLALRADQAGKVLNGQLDEHTRQAIATRCKIPLDKVVEHIWDEVACFRRTITGNHRLPITEDHATAEEAQRLGGVDKFVGRAQAFVVQRGPLSILVENGADVVVTALREVEAELQAKEERAKTKLDEHQHQASLAGQALQQFEAEAAETLERLDEAGPDHQLAEDFLAQLNPQLRQQLAGEIAQQLNQTILTTGGMVGHLLEKATLKLRNFLGGDGEIDPRLFLVGPIGPIGGLLYRWWNTPAETSLEHAAKQVCTDTFESRLGGQFNQWQAELEDNQNVVFNREIGGRVEKINADIQKRWQRHVPEGMPLLQGVKPPRLSPRLKEALEFARLNPTQDLVTGELMKIGTGVGLAAGGALATIVALAVGKSAVTVLGVTLFTSTQPWMWPVLAAGALAAAFGISKLWNHSEGRQERLMQQIDGELAKQWDELKTGLKPQLKQISHGVRQFYRKQFELNVIPHPRAKFNERKVEADRDFQQSQQHREAVAAESRRLRQDDIEPLRRKLEVFSADCRTKLPQGEEPSVAIT